MAAWAICGLVFVAGLMAQGSVLQPIVSSILHELEARPASRWSL